MSERVHVKIFNQTYSLRSGSDAEHIKRVAQMVDERMRQISAHTETFDLARVAVLAALNIADELQRLKEDYEEERRALVPQPAPLTTKTTEQSDASADSESRKSDEPQSWFEAIFDDDEPVKERRERLSSQVSAKLQSIRPSESESMSLTVEEGK